MDVEFSFVTPPVSQREGCGGGDAAAMIVVARPQGELDLSTADRFKELVAEALDGRPGVTGLVIDLSRVALADSSGLGALNGCRIRMAERGGRTVLCALAPQVRRAIPLAQLDKLMPVADTCEEAVALAAGAAGGM